jgi:hypothetical protein
LKAAYWGVVATRMDPDPSAQEARQILVDTLGLATPNLTSTVETMLSASRRRVFDQYVWAQIPGYFYPPMTALELKGGSTRSAVAI